MGVAYSLTLTATGGIMPYTWSVTGLPSGLSVDTSTGIISGTPTTYGEFALAVTVSDGLQEDGGNYLFLVYINPVPVVIAPASDGTIFIPTFGNFNYCFYFNDARFCCLMGLNTGAGTVRPAIFNSTDDGLTWTELDSSDAPVVAYNSGTSPGWPVAYDVRVNGSRPAIEMPGINIIYSDDAGNVSLIYFDFYSGTYGSPFGATSITSPGSLESFILSSRPDGNLALAFQTGDSVNTEVSHVFWMYWNGSTWSATTEIAAPTGDAPPWPQLQYHFVNDAVVSPPYASVNDNISNVCYFLVSEPGSPPFPPTGTGYCVRVASDGSAVGPAAENNINLWVPLTTQESFGKIIDGEIRIIYELGITHSGPLITPAIPLTPGGSWLFENVLDPFHDTTYIPLFLDDNPLSIWYVKNSGVTRILKTNGVWAQVQTLAWNFITNPPPLGLGTQQACMVVNANQYLGGYNITLYIENGDSSYVADFLVPPFPPVTPTQTGGSYIFSK
jgi:hypothetical protein